LVSIIRLSIKRYKYISYKLSSKQEISQVEEEFFKKIEPTVIASSRKVMLELLECSTTDYGTDEVQKQIIDQELKHKEVIVKEASDSLVQNNENQMEVSFSPYNSLLEESVNEINPKEENIYSSIWASKSKKTPSTTSQKNVVYNFILWDILKEAQANRIRCCLNFYGKATIIQIQEYGKTKVVYVQLISKATSRVEALKKV
ncbi:22545_t:CDS:2, partial [Gigaspora margarita]